MEPGHPGFASMLADLTGTIEDAVVEAGYAGLAVVMAVETVFPPIPSEIVLPFAGFQVAKGTLGFVPALLASTLGAVIGALVLYAVARFGGRSLVLRMHPLLRIGEHDLDRADRWFDRRAVPIVLFGRLVPGVRSLVSVPAGLSEMPLLAFVGATAAGALLWNSALLGAGVLLGANYERVERYVGPFGTVVLIAVVLACLAGVVWLRRRGTSAAA
jgi:membrane protein DedA with SNARE-associated domain